MGRMKKQKIRILVLLFHCFMLSGFLAPISLCFADDHNGRKGHFEKGGLEKRHEGWGRLNFGGHDEGNETTGQIAAWSLVGANLTVVMSLLIRGLKRFVPLRPEVKDSVTRFNSLQKRYLMRFHYVLNPLILGIATLHWMLSRCKSTALPELGLLAMGGIIALGVILKFKLCPKPLLRNVYKVHTQPMVLLVLIFILLVGHLAVD